MNQGPLVFAAKIYKVGLIRFVDVPREVSKALGSGSMHIPVQGAVEGVPLRTTMVPAGNGRHRLAIHGDIRKKLRIDAGTIAEISIELDEESREPKLPPALVAGLKFSKVAAAEFHAMTTALRRQIVRHLTQPKNLATVERRVAKFILHLERNPRYSKRKSAKGDTRSLSSKLAKTSKGKPQARRAPK